MKSKAIFGAGCFWCMEALMRALNGVLDVIAGYAGGAKQQADYRRIVNGDTKHVEVVLVEFDESIISYEALLEIFMTMHDPTSLDKQGADYGPQYRSTIFYTNENQKQIAQHIIRKTQAQHSQAIVTEVKQLVQFNRAEPYHQNFYQRNKMAGYCKAVISPKLKKLKILKKPT